MEHTIIIENGTVVIENNRITNKGTIIPCIDNKGVKCLFNTVNGKTYYHKPQIKKPKAIKLPKGYKSGIMIHDGTIIEFVNE